MAGSPGLLLIGERDLLASVVSPSSAIATLPRPIGEDPAVTGARASTLNPGLTVVFGPEPGEVQAIRQAGLDAVEWPYDWFPVADELFGEEDLGIEPGGIFFSGPTSDARDDYLQPVKHSFDVLHLVGGADLAELKDLMARCTTAIDLAPEPGLKMVDRIGPAMAGGMLVLAQAPLTRSGLEDRRELVCFDSPDGLAHVIDDVLREPESFLDVRRRGREAAEAWRSSIALPGFLAAQAG